MNREIKFRAWDKNSKSMFYKGKKPYAKTIGEMLDWFEDEDLMQYIGLKDKKRTKEFPEGQEIYEGDIVKDAEGEIRTVIWHNASFYFRYQEKKGREDAYIHTSTVEVIGNIYENKELLK